MTGRGLRTRLLLALVAASLTTLGSAWLVVLPTLAHRLERQRSADLRELARAVRPELRVVPAHDRRPGSPALIRIVDRLQARTRGRIAVYDSAGRELADSAPPLSAPSWSVAQVRAMRAAAARAGGVTTGQRGDVAYAATSGGRPAMTLVMEKRADDRAALTVLRASLPLALAAGIAVALALALLLSRSLSRRLARLRADAQALAIHGLEHRVAVEGDDEIAVVARALEDMRERLIAEQHARVDFLATASHELRTPLASLQAVLELLREEIERGAADAETVTQRTNAALRQTRRLIALATDLLDLSRVDGGVPLKPEALEIEELSATVAGEFVARLHAAGRSVTVDGQPALAFADPAAVARIERILLDNAASYGQGTVTIVVASAPQRVQVAIEDEGPGITEADRERIFQRFVRGQTAGAAAGAGLGLAIARGLARAMGGEVAVSGSRFVVTLPAA